MPFLKKLSTAYFKTFVFVNQKFIAEKSPSAILQLFVNDLTRLKDTPVYQKQLAIYFIVAKKCLSFRVKFCEALHYKAPQNYYLNRFRQTRMHYCTITHLDPAFVCTTIEFTNLLFIRIQIQRRIHIQLHIRQQMHILTQLSPAQ